jgi:phage replication-related protein YjqB (UPF0714/DUF867 family)
MVDTYTNYADLAAHQVLGTDYLITFREGIYNPLVHIAIHGGGIESGTTEIADYMAGLQGVNYYTFDGKKPSGNSVLHLTSTHFDEPNALRIVGESQYTISWHGASGGTPQVFMGGADTVLRDKIATALTAAGFTTSVASTELDGNDPANITQKNLRSMGVQLELTLALRQSFFLNGDTSRANRINKTDAFYAFANAVAQGMSTIVAPPPSGSGGAATAPTANSGQSGMPGDTGLPTLAKLYVNGSPLDALNTSLAANTSLIASQQESANQQFFSTPARPNGDTTREVFAVSLSTVQRVNQIGFSLAHFPQRAWVQYMDAGGIWQTCAQQNNLAAVISIQDCIPQVISSGVSDNTHLHPQHFGSGHWTQYLFKISPVTASRFRIVMARLPSENVPVSSLNQPVDYSLGVKDFNLGYQVASRTDVPVVNRSDDVVTESTTIASAADLLGSSVEYTVRENRATDLLAGTGAVWKCAPQPFASAVVCLYADVRDSSGNPQVIEKFYLEPLYTGSTVNIYYSLQIPNPAVFTASQTPLSFPATRPYGAVLPVPAPDGILFPNSASFLDIDNTVVQFDSTQPFQIGMVVQPQFPYTSTDEVAIYDDGVLKVFFGADPTGTVSTGVFQVSLGTMLLTWSGLPFDYNARLRFVLSYDGTNLMMYTPLETTGDNSEEETPPPPYQIITAVSGEIVPGTNPPAVLRIGGSLTAEAEDATPANARLVSLYIKQGTPDDLDTMTQYWADYSDFVVTPEYPQGPQTTDNMLLRYDPQQQTADTQSLNPYGFLGGPGVVYEDLLWTPIGRDYQLKKGFYDFNPTKARFFKFEFTNLIAEPYETDSPMVSTAKIFAQNPDTVPTAAKATAQSSNSGGSGVQSNIRLASVNRYDDQNRLTASGSASVDTNAGSTTTYLPTEAQFVTDPQGAARMALSAPYWNFAQQSPSPTMPRQSATGQHYYEYVTVAATSRVAYFVGLSQIQMYRSDLQIADDTDVYLELFHDASNLVYDLAIPNWTLGEDTILTPQTLNIPLSLTSQPYKSFRTVRALQFATTQSPPKQLLLDSDFDDTSLQFWRPVGDATITPDPFFDTEVGSLVRVDRAGAPVTWSSMEDFASWNGIEDSDPNPYVPTWDTLEGTVTATALGGIQSFQTVEVSPIGKLYAAVRVLAAQTLSSPLFLQLVNWDGSILAEEPAMVSAGQITEWFVEYNIGSGGVPDGTLLWTDIEALGTWDDLEVIGTWNDIAQGDVTVDVHDVTVQLFQNEVTHDVWYVDNLSIFNDAIMWEFSRDEGQTFWPVWDIRNDPNGVFVFPAEDEAIAGGGAAIVWRVTGAAADLSVSAVEVRPWFDSVTPGNPGKYTVQRGGPSLTPLDQTPVITDDPMFQAWHNVIPQDWWYIYRQAIRQNIQPTPVTQRSFLPDTVPVGVDEGSPAATHASVMPQSVIYTGN